VCVERIKLVRAQGGRNKWVRGRSKDIKEGTNAGADGAIQVHADVCIKVVIDMHIEWRGEPSSIRTKDTGVQVIFVGGPE
jgi:hypothetical protein